MDRFRKKAWIDICLYFCINLLKVRWEWKIKLTKSDPTCPATNNLPTLGSMGGVAVRALASHHCDPGSITGFGVICELSLLLILSLASRGFLRFSSLRKNQHS
jgi:hypothetical protein